MTPEREALVNDLRERMNRLPDVCIEYHLFRRCIAALTAQESAEAMRKDAERINWLETQSGIFYNIDRITAVVGVGFNGETTLRAAIDAAMKAEEKK